MKKLASILLVFAIALSCFVFIGCDTEDKLGFFKERKIKKDYIEQFGIQGKNFADVVLDYYGGNYNGYEIVMLDAEWHDPEKWEEKFGSYSITYYDSNILYAYKNGIFMTLSEACKNSYLSIDDLSTIVDKYNNDVRMYIDICDIYDFDKSKCEELDWSNNNIYNSVTIWMDIRSVEGIWELQDLTPIVEYLGDDMIDSIEIESLSYNPFAVFHVKFKWDNKMFFDYAVKRLRKAPAVLMVGPYSKYGWAQSFSGEKSENLSWALKSIEIEKVWDFTTKA